MPENDPSSPLSSQVFSIVEEAIWRNAVADAGQPLDKMIDGVRFPAINTSSDLPLPDPDSHAASLRPFGTLEVALPAPLSPMLRKTVLAADGVGWRTNERDLPTLLDWLSASDSPLPRLSIETTEPNPDLRTYLAYLREQFVASLVSGAVYLPVTQLSYWESNSVDLISLQELTQETSDLVDLATITVRGNQFEAWGARVTDELALTLSWWATYCDQLTDLGLSVETILARTELTLPTDADYFLSIAKFRALRSLVDKIAQAYGLADHSLIRPQVRAVSGLRNKTFYDLDTNLLRNTTEALAALMGGADTLALSPHDFLTASPDPFGVRMVGNTYQILRHEAQLSKVSDPAAGSYFIENLTGQLVEQGWQQFLDWEQQGGFVKLLKNGALEAHCRAKAAEQTTAFRAHRRIAVGTTRYGNAQEQSREALDDSVERWALPFEAIRNTIDQGVAQSKARPAVGVCVQPDTTLANHRRHYVQDVLACLGLATREFILVELSEPANDPSLLAIVFCGTDTYYQTTVADVIRQNPEVTHPRWIAGGSDETVAKVRQAGGDGVLGIGHDLIALIEPLINRWKHEA